MVSRLQTETRNATERRQPEIVVDEAQLVARVRAGDERTCELFVRQYGGAMLAVARRMLCREQDSEDAVQEAFISAFRSIGSFAGNSKLSTWLHRIVVNACLMKLRSRSRQVSIETLLPQFDERGHHATSYAEWGESPVAPLKTADTRARVRACIDKLPEAYRTVVLLRDMEELSTQQTADLLGVTEANVKVRLHRARQALRTLLDPIFTEPSRGRNLQCSAA